MGKGKKKISRSQGAHVEKEAAQTKKPQRQKVKGGKALTEKENGTWTL